MEEEISRCIRCGKESTNLKSWIRYSEYDEPEEVEYCEACFDLATWPRYLNVYEVSQCSGGPEEGGWWYNAGTPIESVLVRSQEESDRVKVQLEEKHDFHNREEWDYERRCGRTSAIGNGYDIAIYEESFFARAFPQRRPHYE